jgi:hypothetical protein
MSAWSSHYHLTVVYVLMNEMTVNRGGVISSIVKISLRSDGEGDCVGDERYFCPHGKGISRGSKTALTGYPSIAKFNV